MHPRRPKSLSSLTRQEPSEFRLLLESIERIRFRRAGLGIPFKTIATAIRTALAGADTDSDFEEVFESGNTGWTTKLKDAIRAVQSATQPSSIERHVQAISRYFSLDAETTALFGLVARVLLVDEFECLRETFCSRALSVRPRDLAGLAIAAGVPRDCAVTALSPDGVLISAGLCTVDDDGDLSVAATVVRLIRTYPVPPPSLDEHMIGRLQTAGLQWSDFAHLGDEREVVTRVIMAASSGDSSNVHILLYGPPGTGKTEFAKAIADQVRLPLVSIGETGAEKGEPARKDRIADLSRAAHVLRRRQSKSILLVDEAEDVLELSQGFSFPWMRAPKFTGSKVFIHRLLETFPAPVIWTVNDISRLPPTVIRRMTYALELGRPGPTVRRQIWSRTLNTLNIAASDSELDSLARDFESAPAIAASAARTASLIGGGLGDLRKVATSLHKALDGGRAPKPFNGVVDRYEPALVHADARSLRALEAMAGSGAAGQTFSLCLHGPPGTGKSAYARHLGEKLGLPVIHKRASDLLSMWVGETEQKIAEAFAEARQERAMLIFDEADSMLRSREGNRATWEITQVNEMLTWMESHPLPFVCTTNLVDALDAASLRRFTFKIRFDYLDRERARHAYVHFFGRAAPCALDHLALLTPADFALVRKRATLGGMEGVDAALLEMLGEECSIKPDFRRSIGFGGA